MTKQRIAYLLDRYIQAQLTEAEDKELEELLLDPSCEEAIKEFLDAQWNDQQNNILPSAAQQSRILDAIQQHEPYAAPVVPMYKRSIRWMPAAAVAMLLLVLTLLFVLKQDNNNRKKDIIAQPAYPIQPGGNKALLTLANGQVIALDTAGNGTLAQQGTATIIKFKDGQLTYNSTDQQPREITINTLATPRGGEYMLVLQDGTKVWLNAETKLRFPTDFRGDSRTVELSGEAYFEVAKNQSKPFIVLANNTTQVKVLGTHFNVMAYRQEDSIVTTLLEGSVNVSIANTPKGKILMPGQQALYSHEGLLSVNNDADTEQAVAWKNGKLLFRNQDIQTIMQQVARWYNVDVEINGNINDRFTINVARNVPIEKLLKYIELSGGVHFRIQGKKIIVQP